MSRDASSYLLPSSSLTFPSSSSLRIAYLVKSALDLDLPRRMQVAFYQVIQKISESTGKELSVADITSSFQTTYFLATSTPPRFILRSFNLIDTTTPLSTPNASNPSSDDDSSEDRKKSIVAKVSVDGVVHTIKGDGNGPLSSLIDALSNTFGIELSVREYSEHAVGQGSSTRAASYVELISPDIDPKDRSKGFWGVGIDVDITSSGLRAVLSAASSYVGKKAIEVVN